MQFVIQPIHSPLLESSSVLSPTVEKETVSLPAEPNRHGMELLSNKYSLP